MSPPRLPVLGRANVAALGLLALAVVALTLEGFAGHLPSVRDMPSATLPSRWFWRESVLGGHLAIWNPYISLGTPTIAGPVHGSLYPFQMLVALLPFRAGFFATWALHMLLGGAGGYALARSCGCRSESALVSGLVWAVGGYATSMWWNGEKLLPTEWIPWIAWGVRETALGPRVLGKHLVLGAASGAMLCAAGDPFLLFDAALLAVIVALIGVPERPAAPPLRIVAASSAVFVLAIALAAPVLLPAALVSPDTARGPALTLHDAQLWSMHPVRWLELFVPRPFGNPLSDADAYPGAPYADTPLQVHPWAVSMFLGSATLALATAARGRRVILPLWGGVLVAVLLALGRHTPFDGWERHVVPGLALSRFPEKHAVVACGAITLLGSLGAEEILALRASLPRVIGVAFAGLVLAVLLAPAPLRATTRPGAVHAAIAIVAVAGVFYATRRDARFAWLVGVVLATDLVTSSRTLLEWMPASALDPPPIARELATHPGEPPRRILRLPSSDFRRIETLPYNAASLFDVDVVSGWDPGVSPFIDLISVALAERGGRLLELLRIDAVLLPDDPDLMRPVWTVKRAPARPRAWMVGLALPAKDDAQALKALAAPDFDPESAAVVAAPEVTPEVAALAAGEPRALGACDVADYQAARVRLRCRPSAAALLVLPDTAMRGWVATVDGVPAPIVRTNVAMRGVALSVGAHEIEMRFEPPGLVEGFLVATIGLLVAALAIVRARGQRA
ncbi:MAG: hypothetical protein ACLQBL_40490 [Polyangiaceae bacterium]